MKPPVFLTSTFVFKSAEHGKEVLRLCLRTARAAGRRDGGARLQPLQSSELRDRRGSSAGLRGCRSGATYFLGMAAIATTILATARPGDVILHSQPLYGGTETLVTKTLTAMGIKAVGFADGVDETVFASRRRRSESAGARVDHADDRDPVEPTEHAGRHRAGAETCRRDRRGPKALRRSWSATTRCSVRSSRSR